MKDLHSSKSSSVSPRTPTMTSTPMNALGIICLILLILYANRAVSYFRCISLSSSSLPLCSGMWKCGAKWRDVATKSIISSVRRLGSMLDIRYLTSPSRLSKACMSSKNVSPVLRPKSPVFTPVRTISLAPSAMAF